jgi:flagellar protein FliL
MAKDNAQDGAKAEAPPSGGGMGQLIISIVLAVVIGGAGGAAFGFLAPLGGAQRTAASTDADHPDPAHIPGRFPDDAMEIGLEPIIADLDGPQRNKVRLDLAIIAAHGTPANSPLKSEIREDVIALLRGVKVADIEGVRGFQNLRQQLEDRAKIRGRGAILGLLIGGLAIQ